MTIYILIPAYEPNEKLGQLTKELIPAFPVTIVDDGSGEAYLDVFRHAEELGATILRHDINRDKGAALKTGIAAIMQREADGMRVFLMLLPAGQSYAAARFFSAALNYYLNCRLVFGGRPTVSNFVGYALLALVLLTICSVAVGLFASMVTNKVLAKLSIDPALFLFNYAMQKRWSGRLSAGKTVKFKFLGTGMVSVMPVPLLAAHPRKCSPQGRTRYVPSACVYRWTCQVHLHRPP